MSVSQNTVDEMAAEVGVSGRTLARYFREGCPRGTVEEIQTWRHANIRTTTGTDSDATPEAGSIAAARLQLIKKQTQREAAAAEKLELENAARRGELVDRVEVERNISLVAGRFRNRLESLGMQIAVLMPAEMKATVMVQVDGVVNLALKELADGLMAYSEQEDDE